MVTRGKGQDLLWKEKYEYFEETFAEDGNDDKDIMKKIGKGKRMTSLDIQYCGTYKAETYYI